MRELSACTAQHPRYTELLVSASWFSFASCIAESSDLGLQFRRERANAWLRVSES